jgi:putative ABC transport system permease protein
MAEEMAAHIEQCTQANIAAGMSAGDARFAAQRQFGGVDQLKEHAREQRGVRWLENFQRDLRFAFRQLAKSPGFTAVAVLSLGLGVGACTTLFSLINRILIQPLQYSEPEQLVQLWESGRPGNSSNVTGGVAKIWQDEVTTLQGAAVMNLANRTHANLTGQARAARLRGLQVSSNYLRVLRLNPILGRDFLPEEGEKGRSDVVILSHAAWQTHFAGNPQLTGQTIQLGDTPRTVIGILPAAPRLFIEADFLTPFAYGEAGWTRSSENNSNFGVVARLKSSATIEQLRAEMSALSERIRSQFSVPKPEWGALVVPLHEQLTGNMRPQLLLLFGATTCVLLIACANVAGLLLARAVSRQKEMALRLALGAGRWAIIRQLLTENLLLALAGGAAGVVFAFWGVAAFERWRPADFAPDLTVSIDGGALIFAVVISLATGLAAGLAPAWQLARTHFGELKSGSRSSAGGAHLGARGALIVGQIALSLVLLVSAGLLLRSLVRIQSAPLGFDPRGVLVADLTLDSSAARNGSQRALHLERIVQRVAAVPGVESVGTAGSLPLEGGDLNNSIAADGVPNAPRVSTSFDFITGDYFKALGIPLLAGRVFAETDNRANAPRTIIVSAPLAAQLFPGENAIGRGVQILGKRFEIVGIAGQVLSRGAQGGEPRQVYLPEAFAFWFNRSLVVRSALPPASLAKSVEAAVLSVAPDQPLAHVRTYDQIVQQTEATRQLVLGLLAWFAASALLLAAVGLYGIIAFSVDRRTHELGIRTALGASRKNIFLLVIGSAFKLTAAGIVLGLVGGYFVSRLLVSFLFGVSSTDPLTLLGVTLLLAAVAFIACLLPARRAMKIEPMIALRTE